jgi:ubiquinone/menaquinone biosynthesis C-methylase UbiE
MPSPSRRGRYGIDAPPVLFGILMGALPPLVIGAKFADQWWGKLLLAIGVFNAISAVLYIQATKWGKFKVWARELEALGLKGNERIVDLGCGRGAVLTMAAELVPGGKVVGVDLWRSVDQSGNQESVTRANAQAEGVSDRVELVTADLRELPFKDGEFDVVLSSLAIHNIKTDRDKAVREAVRVCKAKGRILIVDIFKSGEYAGLLRQQGYAVVHRPVGWRMWCGGPWVSASVVEVTKP